jgi:hypothetical protein
MQSADQGAAPDTTLSAIKKMTLLNTAIVVCHRRRQHQECHLVIGKIQMSLADLFVTIGNIVCSKIESS